MVGIIFVIIFGLILSYAAWQYYLVPSFIKPLGKQRNTSVIWIILLAGFIIRLICAYCYKGFGSDMACFKAWSDNVFKNGFAKFYQPDSFTDYPPGYMYILYVMGAIKNLFSIQNAGYDIVIKMPAIIADLACGYLIYSIASKKLSSSVSAVLSLIYILNPAVITDSGLWGQVDSVYTVFIVLMVWLISERKMAYSYFVFAMCILIKPHAFIYTPLVIFGIVENYIYPKFDRKGLLKTIATGIGAIAFMVLLAVPFGLDKVFNQYLHTLSEYPYFTINAFNLWGMFGLNWRNLNAGSTILGYLLLVAIVAAATAVFFKSRNKSKYFYTAAILAFFTFMLSTKMHERYGFPTMIFLLLAVIETKNLHVYAMYVLTTLSQFFNIAWILFYYDVNGTYAFNPIVKIASAVNVAIFIYVCIMTYKLYYKNGLEAAPKGTASKAAAQEAKAVKTSVKKPRGKGAFHFQKTAELAKLTRVDVLIMLAIMAVYSAVAIYDLGDTNAPQTGIALPSGEARMDFGNDRQITSMRIHIGGTAVTAENPLVISYQSEAEGSEEQWQVITSAAANSWLDLRDLSWTAKYVTLSAAGADLTLNEAHIFSGGLELTPSNLTTDLNLMGLFNEAASLSPQDGTLLSSAVVDFGKMTDISSMKFFLGARELNSDNRRLRIVCFDDNNNITYSNSISSGSVFYWNENQINASARKAVISTTSDNLYLNELSFKAGDGTSLIPYSSSFAALFDEQNLVPDRATFRNGTYFDEIYHARTAYEFIHHLPVYEWTHPPLGKIFISLGIMLFGMTPFGWRIAGTVFGIFMIPLIYIFARKLLKKQWLAVVTCLLFTFDFMHFAQTRIATIDVYVTFFIILMYLFMFKYYTMSFYDSPLKKTFIPLGLCGIAMGFGIASKWTGMYAGAGLAIIFFYTLYRRYAEYCHAYKNPKGETDGISHRYVIDNFGRNMVMTLGFCVVFFVIVPAIIYGLSYIPYLLVPDSHGLKTIIENQQSMLAYHGSTVLGSTHPYSSKWYEWIIMKRPIWYYSGTVENMTSMPFIGTTSVKEGISAFGNPLVWWLGIPAFFLLVYTAFEKKDKLCIFLIIGYLAQLVPWMGVERLTFIYHYFPCVPFIALMIGYSIKLLYEDAKYKNAVKICVFVYVAQAIVMFIMFYPVLSGHPCTMWYAEHFLKWFNSWVLL